MTRETPPFGGAPRTPRRVQPRGYNPTPFDRATLEALPIDLLAHALAGDSPFVFYDYDGETRFRCPRCRHSDQNQPSAVVQAGWKWLCERCHATGTKAELERLVAEDVDAVERLILLVFEDGAA